MGIQPSRGQKTALWAAAAGVILIGGLWATGQAQQAMGPLAHWLDAPSRSALLQFQAASGLYLLYTMPIGAAVVVFARMVIGMKSFGLFTPMLMAMAFLQTGPVMGPVILALAIMAGLAIAPLLKRLKMARVGFLAGLMAVISLFLIAAMPYLQSPTWVTAFPVVVTALAVERWWVVWDGEGLWDACKIAASTMAIAIAIEIIVLSPPVAWLVEFSPYAGVIVGGVVSLACGLYRGLRLTELSRFAAARETS